MVARKSFRELFLHRILLIRRFLSEMPQKWTTRMSEISNELSLGVIKPLEYVINMICVIYFYEIYI